MEEKNIGTIISLQKKAPFYDDTIQLINNIFIKEYNTIAQLNIDSLKMICGYLNLATKIEVFSEMNLPMKEPRDSDEWSLNICKALNCAMNDCEDKSDPRNICKIKNNVTEYWNAPGGINLYDDCKYNDAGIKLRFLKNYLTPYDQKRNAFESGLSIIDVLMFNTIEETNLLLDQFELLNKKDVPASTEG